MQQEPFILQVSICVSNPPSCNRSPSFSRYLSASQTLHHASGALHSPGIYLHLKPSIMHREPFILQVSVCISNPPSYTGSPSFSRYLSASQTLHHTLGSLHSPGIYLHLKPSIMHRELFILQVSICVSNPPSFTGIPSFSRYLSASQTLHHEPGPLHSPGIYLRLKSSIIFREPFILQVSICISNPPSCNRSPSFSRYLSASQTLHHASGALHSPGIYLHLKPSIMHREPFILQVSICVSNPPSCNRSPSFSRYLSASQTLHHAPGALHSPGIYHRLKPSIMQQEPFILQVSVCISNPPSYTGSPSFSRYLSASQTLHHTLGSVHSPGIYLHLKPSIMHQDPFILQVSICVSNPPSWIGSPSFSRYLSASQTLHHTLGSLHSPGIYLRLKPSCHAQGALHSSGIYLHFKPSIMHWKPFILQVSVCVSNPPSCTGRPSFSRYLSASQILHHALGSLHSPGIYLHFKPSIIHREAFII